MLQNEITENNQPAPSPPAPNQSMSMNTFSPPIQNPEENKPKKSKKWLLLILSLVSLVILIGVGLFFFKGKIFSSSKNLYSLPDSLSYSEKQGWKSISGKGWTLSLKDDWGLKAVPGNSNIYYNQQQGDKYLSVQIQLPKSASNTGEFNFYNELHDLETNNPGSEVLYSQLLSINGNNSGVVFFKLGTNNLVSINVVVDKGGTIYHLLISTTQNFYQINKTDIENLIASFK